MGSVSSVVEIGNQIFGGQLFSLDKMTLWSKLEKLRMIMSRKSQFTLRSDAPFLTLRSDVFGVGYFSSMGALGELNDLNRFRLDLFSQIRKFLFLSTSVNSLNRDFLSDFRFS